MRCIECREKFTPTKFLQKHCENCKEAEREYQSGKMAKTTTTKKPIKQISDKRKLENIIYTSKKIKFFMLPENQVCPVSMQKATEIHHTYCGKDRATYYLDESTWIGVSRDGHNWIHDHPKESRELGLLK